MDMEITSFREFWPVYLRAHADPRCRALHYAGSICGIAGALAAAATQHWQPAAAGVVAAYGFAWIGHIFVERNTPLTFRHPLWSVAADYRMFARWVTGRLPADLANAGT